MATWKSLRVQGFMIDPESIGALKEIKLGCHDGNLGNFYYGYGHSGDSSSISLFFSYVLMGYDTYHSMHSYIPSCM